MAENLEISAVAELHIPPIGFARLTDYFGAWQMEWSRLSAGYEYLRQMDIAVHARATHAARSEDGDRGGGGDSARPVGGTDGIAFIRLDGALMKHVGSMEAGTSTVAARRQVRAARGDDAVKAVIVVIDSPGGTVAGAYELAEDIAALAATKPTYAYIENLGASAGYLQAVQTREISVNATGIVGSIGTYAVVYDYSKMFEKEGVRAVLLSSDKRYKGAGTPGTVITEEQVAAWMVEIEDLNAAFIDSVARGRRVARAKVETWADGRVHVGERARAMGLVDRVETLDTLVQRVRGEIRSGGGAAGKNSARSAANDLDTRPKSNHVDPAAATPPASEPKAEEEMTMADKNDDSKPGTMTAAAAILTVAAASMTDIDQACPGASSDFKIDCARQNMTLPQVQTAFTGWQAAQLRDRDAQITKLTTDHAAALASLTGDLATAKEKAKAVGGLTPLGNAAEQPKSNVSVGVGGSQAKAQAEKEWDENAGGCQQSFGKKEAYVGFREMELQGKAKVTGKR